MRCAGLGVVFALALTSPARAQSGVPQGAADPGWLVKRYFVDRAFPDEASYLVGEMAAQDIGRTVGSMLPPGFKFTFRRLMLDGDRTVYTVQVVGQGQINDSYAFLQKDSLGWRLAAVRSLKLTRDFTNALIVLRQQHNLPDSTRESFLNMQLLAAPDTVLRSIIRDRRQTFGSLISEYRAQGDAEVTVLPSGRPAPGSNWGAVGRRLASLHLQRIYRLPAFPGCTFVEIGRYERSTAGYIHDDGGCHPPAISPDLFIYVERVVADWWAYKTS